MNRLRGRHKLFRYSDIWPKIHLQ